MPLQDMETIGDRLDAAKPEPVTWAWYAGGWDDAVKAGQIDPESNFQTHHQPFAYFRNYAKDADGRDTPGRLNHLLDENKLNEAIAQNKLPQVVFYKPFGLENEHPGYANVLAGDKHIADLLCQIETSPFWSDSIVIVTFDENGGYWDHVPPPKGDRWGPGARVPTVIISPFAKKGYLDHTTYDTTAILKLIEKRFGLAPLGGERFKDGNDLTAALDFDNDHIKTDNRVCKTREDKPKPETTPAREPEPKP